MATFSNWFEGLKKLEGAPLLLAGVVPEARPGAVAALVLSGSLKLPALVVVPDPESASEVAAGLKVLLKYPVFNLPPELASPYMSAQAPYQARRSMMEALLALAEGDPPPLLVAPARLLPAMLPKPNTVAQHTLELRLGQELDLAAAARHLAEAGFRRVELVEQPGEFAVRGALLDVHDGGEYPTRVELEHTTIVSIQPYDAATQRRLGRELERVKLLPVEIASAYGEETRSRLAELIRAEFPGLASKVQLGVDQDSWAGFVPAVSDGYVHLFRLPSLRLVVCSQDEVLASLGAWYRVLERERRLLSSGDTELPEPDLVVAPQNEVADSVREAACCIELAPPSKGDCKFVKTSKVGQRPWKIADEIRALRSRGTVQILVAPSKPDAERILKMLSRAELEVGGGGPGALRVVVGELKHGFVWGDVLAVWGVVDLFGEAPRPRTTRRLADIAADALDVTPGDLVVHEEHGIGRFLGFKTVDLGDGAQEMLEIEYADGKLFVPVHSLDKVSKYLAPEDGARHELDRMGGVGWKRRRRKAAEGAKEIASKLLELAARRKSSSGHAFSPDSPWQREFEDNFPYRLTRDQAAALAEVKRDMESPKPMDRLLCGDVGYGKTEIAVRAAFKAVLDGKQVALLAPTTVLVEQHLRTFRRRMEGYPVRMEALSRMRSAAEARKILEDLEAGLVDIVIGTHRLLADDVKFADLGLVIIDEEQRFGVEQKERLKSLRATVDVLSMSATPIPRTLNMALMGLKDVSVIETPPAGRKAVETFVMPYSEAVVRRAILFEMERGGKVFYVHNRITELPGIVRRLREMVPHARIVVAHGRMSEEALAEAMLRFADGDADLLVATAIVENGLDIASANTLIVDGAELFGLAQLYQLRGRVGRSDTAAFAYLLTRGGASPKAEKRLKALKEFSTLGAGFRLALRDLELRGAGDLLGRQQHGFICSVGFHTYMKLLEEAVRDLKGIASGAAQAPEVLLRLGLDLRLPPSYIRETALRLSLYKKVAAAKSEEELRRVEEEAGDRYGPPPPQFRNLLVAQRIRLHSMRLGLSRVERFAGGFRLVVSGGGRETVEVLVGYMPGIRNVKSSGKEVVVEVNVADAGELVGWLGWLCSKLPST